MTRKLFLRYLFSGSLFVLLSLIILFAAIYYYLPYYFESRLLPKIAEATAIDYISADVEHINFFKTRINRLRCGRLNRFFLTIDDAQIFYTPGMLWQHHIEKIVISGLTLSGEYSNGTFRFPGLSLDKVQTSIRAEKAPLASERVSVPFSIGKLDIQNSRVDIVWENRRIKVPFALRIDSDSKSVGTFNATLELSPRDQMVTIAATMNTKEQSASLYFDGRAIRPETFSDFMGGFRDFNLTGMVDFAGNIQMELHPFSINTFDVNGRLVDTSLRYGNFDIKTGFTETKAVAPFHINFSKTDHTWLVSLAPIVISSPFPFHLSSLKGSARQTAGGIEFEGRFLATVDPFNEVSFNSFGLRKSLLLPLSVSGNFQKVSRWTFQLSGIEKDALTRASSGMEAYVEGYTVHSGPPSVLVSGNRSDTGILAEYRVTLPKVKAINKDNATSIDRLDLKGKMELPKIDFNQGAGNFDIKLTETSVKTPIMQILMPSMSVIGQSYLRPSLPLGIKGRISMANGLILHPSTKIRLDLIDGELPLVWPLAKNRTNGKLTIKSVAWGELSLGAIDGILQEQADGFLFNGKFVGTLFPDLLADMEGHWKKFEENGTSVDFVLKVAPYIPHSDLDLGKIMASARGMKVNGNFKANGMLHVDESGISSELSVNWVNGTVINGPMDFNMEGINTDLYITDVLNFHSLPDQHLEFETASFGKLKAIQGKIDYQLEAFDSIFIKQVGIKWCGGNIYSYGIRLSPAMKTNDITLYCDRIRLSDMLNQLLSVNALGNGTVNGRIPMVFDRMGIRFENGFLYSTPGDGGNIRLTKTEMITAGIPVNTPQYTQLELAREALKDYHYSWVKVDLENREDLLLIGMHLDGKPAKPLPFTYREDLGGFTKVDAGSPGSTFEGIRLDVNFRIPFDKMFQMGKSLKHIYDGTP